MIVHKFGGTSVGDAERIVNVSQIICNSRRERPTVVVVSAIGGVTNRLIAVARAAAGGDREAVDRVREEIARIHLDIADALPEGGPDRSATSEAVRRRIDRLSRFLESLAVLGELTARGHDAVVAFGEHLSADLLAATVRSRGVDATAVSATELIVTDGVHGAAKPQMAPTKANVADRVLPLCDDGIVPIITGYVGATPDGVTTTLGRSGSDYSAAVIAACVGANELRIWTDVNGILTADPNVVPDARILRELTYQEAAQLARFGAEVLHPRTIGPIVESCIPLRIVNSFDPTDPGTCVMSGSDSRRRLWPSIISASDLRLLPLRAGTAGWRLESAAFALRTLADAGIDVLMFSQSVSEQGLLLVVRKEDVVEAERRLCTSAEATVSPLDPAPPAAGAGGWAFDSIEPVGTVSVVGFGTQGNHTVASRAFAALGEHGVPVLAVTQAALEDSVSFCVRESAVPDTVRLLHRALGLEPCDAR